MMALITELLRKIKTKPAILAGGGFVLFLFVIFSVVNSSVLKVEGVPVRYGMLVSTFETKGQLQSKNEIEIQSKESGLISQLLVLKGESVLANTPLVEYDVEEVQKKYELSKILYELGGESKNNFLKLQKQIDNYNLVAPFNAVILETYVQAGNWVTAGSRIVKLADQDHLQALVEVDEADLGRIRVGQRVDLTGESVSDTSFSGGVTSIDQAASFHENRAFFRVIVDLEEVPSSVQLGSQLVLRIVTDEKSTLYIPLAALVMKGDKSYVWKNKGNRARLEEVKTGIFNTQSVEILSGVAKDDLVILDNHHLKQGTRISILKNKNAN